MSVPKDLRGIRNYHLARMGLTRNSPSFQILSVRLDSWFVRAGEPHVTFVKIDTEGHELACIRGMLLFLARSLPSLCVEVSSDLDAPLRTDRGWKVCLRNTATKRTSGLERRFDLDAKGSARPTIFFSAPIISQSETKP